MEELEIKNELKRTNDLLLKLNKLDLFDNNRNDIINELFNNRENLNIGSNLYIDLASYINIDSDVRIDNNVSFITKSVDFYDRDKIDFKPITIKKNTYIGPNTVINGGVTIGENAYIMAGSVVREDILPNTIVEGNPLKVIKSLDDNAFKKNANNDLIPLYELENGTISKDPDKNLYLIVNNKSLMIAEGNTYMQVIVPDKENKVFILGDSIRVLNLDLKLDNPSDYKISFYSSSYYYDYHGVYRRNGYFTVNTDDGDIIALKFYDNNAKFKRIFDYEIDKIEDLIKDL